MVKFLQYIAIFLYFLNGSLHGMNISKSQLQEPLLSDSKMYIDHTKKVTIETIEEQAFTPIEKNELGFGYGPDFDVWIKIELNNPYDEKLTKIIEYTNPLTTTVELYDASTHRLLDKGGTSADCTIESINPAFAITLQAHEHKTYYLKASSSVTTLIVGLTLWDMRTFYEHESKHQFTLALFFGAMGIIILYNLFIYLFAREKVYLYYVLGFAGIIFHHLFYKGLAGLYFFSPDEVMGIVKYASFIVATPAFFLALFTKNILKLEQYPRLTKFLNSYLVVFVFMTVLSYLMDWNNLRNLFSVLLLLTLFFITLYALIHHNRQAKFIMLGWIALLSSGILMYLSSVGYYDIFSTFPYYVELSLLMETLLFSLILADRLKQLRLEKIASQNQFIAYQEEEENRLRRLVEERTSQLQVAVKEKDLLLQELNHRVKNSIQTIVSFLRLQIDETNDSTMQQALMHIENRIMSISHLYSLLYAKHNSSYISAQEYFSLLIDNIRSTLHAEHIDIQLDTNVTLHSEIAVYCGFIINEAITNALQHAFDAKESGDITIVLSKNEKTYLLNIKDNGKGFDTSVSYESLGLVIIESLATYQLHGTLKIDAKKGTHIMIQWEERDE
jgi:two-component sensor histidine kinase